MNYTYDGDLEVLFNISSNRNPYIKDGNLNIDFELHSLYYNRERVLEEILIYNDIRFGFHELEDISVNSDIRYSSLDTISINSDIRFASLAYNVAQINSIDEIDIKLDGVSIIDEVDIDSTQIHYKLGNSPSQTVFTLARRHDNIDYTLDNVYRQISNENKIEIYYLSKKIYTGYVTTIDCDSTRDLVTITAEDARYKLSNASRLKLYRGYFQKDERENIVDDGNTIYHTNRTALQYVLNQAITNSLISGYDSTILNYLNIELEGQEITDTYTNCIDNLLKEVLFADWYLDENEYIQFVRKQNGNVKTLNLANLDTQRTIYDAILTDVNLNKIQASYLTAINIIYGKEIINKFIKHTSYDLPSENFYWSTNEAKLKTHFSFQTYQNHLRYIGERATNYGYWTGGDTIILPSWLLQINSQTEEIDIDNVLIGTGDIKRTIDYSNFGKQTFDSYYEERSLEDGTTWLYLIKPTNYDFTDYVNDIAYFEFYKNNQLLTTSRVSIFLENFLFNNIKLGNRINLDNTIGDNIYNGNNGFPLDVESVEISLKDRIVSLNLSNYGGSYYCRTVSYNNCIYNENDEIKLYKKVIPIIAGQGLD